MAVCRRILALCLAAALCLMCADARAVSPNGYMDVLTRNIERYSGSSTWRRVATLLAADGAGLFSGDGDFAVTDADGYNYITTGAAAISISGATEGGDITRLSISVTPVGRAGSDYDYQAFSLCEIAFESLMGDAGRGDMCSYLFLYDVYPYAMWANDSRFTDRSRSITTALGGVEYQISSAASASDRSVTIDVRVKGTADSDLSAAASRNLNANYALESIASLIYELDACAYACEIELEADPDGDAAGRIAGDMLSCIMEYESLGADAYGKLSALTQALSPLMAQMRSALIDIMQGDESSAALQTVSEAVTGMKAALREMY